jgi:hypothetical protein
MRSNRGAWYGSELSTANGFEPREVAAAAGDLCRSGIDEQAPATRIPAATTARREKEIL